MPAIEITLTYKVFTEQEKEDEDFDGGTEVSITLPAKYVVCDECDGTGFVLAGGLRGMDFTESEFYECFEEPEDREEYFRPGGKYDTVCDVCHGQHVVKVVADEENLNEEQKKHLEDFAFWEENAAPQSGGSWRNDPDARAERRAMGIG